MSTFNKMANSDSTQRPIVGVGVIILKGGKVLLGKRKSSHGAGSWSFPGGHLEFGESLENCAQREVEEEAGIKMENLRFAAITNNIFEKENKHYLTVFMQADHASGVATLLEPEKCEQWEWFAWNNLPEPLFKPIQNLVKDGFNPLQPR